MNAKILYALTLIVLGFVLANVMVPMTPASADGPVPGLPWGKNVPWPTAQPLKLGMPFSPAQPSSPVSPAVVAPAPAPLGVMPLNTGSSVIYVTPVPPLVASSQVVVPSAPSVLPPQVSPPVVNSGASRNDALTPTGDWQTLAGGSEAWYLIGTGGPHIEVWMTAEPHLNVTLDIFAPNESSVPIGRGTPSKKDPTTVYWSGGSWRTNGNWYARVTNYYAAPIRYMLNSTATQLGTKSCYSYWEYIGKDYVYWTRCN